MLYELKKRIEWSRDRRRMGKTLSMADYYLAEHGDELIKIVVEHEKMVKLANATEALRMWEKSAPQRKTESENNLLAKLRNEVDTALAAICSTKKKTK